MGAIFKGDGGAGVPIGGIGMFTGTDTLINIGNAQFVRHPWRTDDFGPDAFPFAEAGYSYSRVLSAAGGGDTGGFRDICYAGNQTWFAVPFSAATSARIVRTVDGGLNWSLVDTQQPTKLSIDADNNGVVIYATSSTSFLRRSANNGESFSNVSRGASSSGTITCIRTNKKGLWVYCTSAGTVHVSTDGLTFAPVTVPGPYNLTDIAFDTDNDRVIIVGSNGRYLCSNDNGQSFFSRRLTLDDVQLRKVVKVSDGFVMVGDSRLARRVTDSGNAFTEEGTSAVTGVIDISTGFPTGRNINAFAYDDTGSELGIIFSNDHNDGYRRSATSDFSATESVIPAISPLNNPVNTALIVNKTLAFVSVSGVFFGRPSIGLTGSHYNVAQCVRVK